MMSVHRLLLLCFVGWTAVLSSAYVVVPVGFRSRASLVSKTTCPLPTTTTLGSSTSEQKEVSPEAEPTQTLGRPLVDPTTFEENMERAWRHAKKPLLRIGKHGAGETHGNALKELLAAHTVVKVKVNGIFYGMLSPSTVFS